MPDQIAPFDWFVRSPNKMTPTSDAKAQEEIFFSVK